MEIDPSGEFVRYIGKNGDLEFVSESSIDWARGLSCDEKIALYVKVRDESQRLEDEWRNEFVAKVRIEEHLLPTPIPFDNFDDYEDDFA
jgi:hypothetical protein